MEFLFDTIILNSNHEVFYRVYKTGKVSFFAELTRPDTDHADFQFKKVEGAWVADHVAHQKYAEALGVKVEAYLPKH